MKTFGDDEIEWVDSHGVHVLVATRGASWGTFCTAHPSRYETVEQEPKPTDEPVVWRHDLSKVTCQDCVARVIAATAVPAEPHPCPR